VIRFKLPGLRFVRSPLALMGVVLAVGGTVWAHNQSSNTLYSDGQGNTALVELSANNPTGNAVVTVPGAYTATTNHSAALTRYSGSVELPAFYGVDFGDYPVTEGGDLLAVSESEPYDSDSANLWASFYPTENGTVETWSGCGGLNVTDNHSIQVRFEACDP
jgi:hypothetical protein